MYEKEKNCNRIGTRSSWKYTAGTAEGSCAYCKSSCGFYPRRLSGGYYTQQWTAGWHDPYGNERILPSVSGIYSNSDICLLCDEPGIYRYDLQNAIRTELLNRGIYKTVSTVLTQVVVDPYDEAFYHPAKVIGRVMTKEEAEEEEKKGNHVTEVEGGYRRIVASPKPMDIVEIDAISALSDADQVVIACGGGGIPVLAQNNRLQGASAVIEKDLAAGKLAELLDADMLVILTSVDKVCLNYGKEDEVKLDTLSLADAKKYLAAGEFGEGTMAPKIEAAIDFIGESAIRSVLVTKLNKEAGEITGGMGTLIKK